MGVEQYGPSACRRNTVRPSHILTCVPRRQQHCLGSQASYETLWHPHSQLLGSTYPRPPQRLRRKLETARWHHQRAGNPRAGRSEAWSATKQYRTWTLNLDRDLDQNPGLLPDVSPTLNLRSVASHAKCWLTAHMFQQLMATCPRSAQLLLFA